MLKGAIIGFGKIVQNSHLPAFLSGQLKGEVSITSAVEPDNQNRNICEKIYPDIKFYSSTDELYDKEHIDFVDIAAPPGYHAAIIEKAVLKNLHIICEKPFIPDINEALPSVPLFTPLESVQKNS
jgi:predicted dehydrogenase